MDTQIGPSQTLGEKRFRAAEASGGISSNAIYNRLVEIIQECGLSGRILDYGAGVGNLTLKLAALGRFQHIAGADILPRPESLPAAIPWHCMDLNQENRVASDSFDVVIAAEVIEHLENPREVARDWYRILAPGGTLVISTPNNESIRSLTALVFRGHYAAFGDDSYPAHITALLRKDLIRILGEAGFDQIRFQFTNQGGLPKAPSITWQRVSLGLLKGAMFSDNIIAVAIK